MATLLGLSLLVSVLACEEPASSLAGASSADSQSPSADGSNTVSTASGLEPYGIWDDLAQCESTQRWHIVSPPYYGGLQEDLPFWRRYGGVAYASRPDLASREAQIAVARRGLAVQGWAAWPACSRRLGLR